MSERLTPEQLDALTNTAEINKLVFCGHHLSAVISQAASDARLIAALETWLEAERDHGDRYDQGQSYRGAMADVLVQLHTLRQRTT